MEERTDLRIGCSRRGENVRNPPFLRILTPARRFGFSKEPCASRSPSFCLREPLPPLMGLVRRRAGTGPTRSRSAAVKPSTSTSPRLVLTLLPVTLQMQRGVQKSFAALQRQEPHSDEREHFSLQEQLIIHTQP